MATFAPGNKHKTWGIPAVSTTLPLPLRHTNTPETTHHPLTATTTHAQALLQQQRLPQKQKPFDITKDFGIAKGDLATVYLSLDPYFDAFKQPINLCKFNITRHATVDLDLYESDGQVHLMRMIPGTPAAKIPDW
jgi:hypothetical protein